METRAITTAEAGTPARQWNADEIDTIRRTVAEGASDPELKMFLHLSQSYGLDPFARDIWFIKAGGRPVIMTSRDGYLKIANRDPHYRGMKADVVCAGDLFERTENGVRHAYNTKERGAPIGAYAIVKRDDREVDTYVFAPFREYNRNGGTWRQYPSAMILKVAESMALKRAFSISGLVTREEMEDEEMTARLEPKVDQGTPLMEWAKHIYNRFLAVCGSPERAKEAMMAVVPKGSKDYTQEDLIELAKEVSRLENQAEAEPTVEAEYQEPQEPEGGEIVPEMVNLGEVSPEDEVRDEILKIMGEGWLGFSLPEREEFFWNITKKTNLDEIPMLGLTEILNAAKKLMAKREKEEK